MDDPGRPPAAGGRARPAAGGGRWVDVAPERWERWLAGFAHRHGPVRWSEPDAAVADPVRACAADGTEIAVHPVVPFRWAGPEPLTDALTAHVGRRWRIGLLLVRRGGHAVGLAEGPAYTATKVGARHVQGRSAAGGWSQQRFARRREQQTRAAAQAAADAAAGLLLPARPDLDVVVTGGDRPMLGSVLADPRLRPLRPLVADRVLDVPEPRRATLDHALAAARAVRVRLVEPGPGAPAGRVDPAGQDRETGAHAGD